MFEKNILADNNNFIPKNNVFYYGRVVDVNDPLGGKRVKVRIKGLDDKISDENLSWALPFLPLNLVIQPKNGEMVKILFPSINDSFNKREWVGPVFSSYENLEFQSANNALMNQDISGIESGRSVNKMVSANGAYPEGDDVGLQSRNNSDLILKDKEALLRAGKYVYNNKTKTNVKNPSYLQLKLSKDGKQSYGSVVADKINLITHQGKNKYKYNLTQEELDNIINNALSAAYAEPIIDFLKLMQDFVANHIHATNLPANKGVGSVPEILKFDLDSIKASNIKIN